MMSKKFQRNNLKQLISVNESKETLIIPKKESHVYYDKHNNKINKLSKKSFLKEKIVIIK